MAIFCLVDFLEFLKVVPFYFHLTKATQIITTSSYIVIVRIFITERHYRDMSEIVLMILHAENSRGCTIKVDLG